MPPTPRALACALLLGLGCHGGSAGPATPDGGPLVPVSAKAVERRDLPLFLEGLGTVVAPATITVRTQVDGQLVAVRFREGAEVRRGQLLALVDPRPFQAALRQAEGALARDSALLRDAELNLGRNRNLRQRHLIAQEVLDDQQAQVDQLRGAIAIDRGQIDTARINLRYARVTSPIDGVAGLRLVDPGNLVHASDPSGIVVVTQVDPIAVLFTLPQDVLGELQDALRAGQPPVEFLARDGEALLGRGAVLALDNQINQTTATLRLKALADNRGRRLWPNQFVKARMLLRTLAGVLVIPSQAVQRGPAGSFAWVVQPDGTAAMRPIEPGVRQGDLTVVTRGLDDGERVVVEGQAMLRPGARVHLGEAPGGEGTGPRAALDVLPGADAGVDGGGAP